MPTEDKIQYAFSTGEVSKYYAHRSDLNKYDIGLFKCLNYFVDPRGGISTRPGSELVGQHRANNLEGRLIRFRGTEQDFLLVFSNQQIRVVQSGGYAVEADLTVTSATTADPAVFTCAGHGLVSTDFATSDWVYVNSMTGASFMDGRLYRVYNATTNTFELREPGYDYVDGGDFTAAVSGTIARVFYIATPYNEDAIEGLSFEQDGNDLYITSPAFARRKLTFVGENNWTLAVVEAASPLSAPTGVSLTASATDDVGVAFAVTAIDADGNESIPSEYELIQNSVNYSTTAGSIQVTWTPVSGAVKYNLYRSVLIPGTPEVTKGELLGYIGTSFGTQFTDTNITPDFTKGPPVHIDPFADGAITYIEITAVGSGYAKSDTISVSGGGGTGFDGYPIVSDAGEITGISIVNGGSGYSAPVTVTVTTSGGSGATFSTTVGPASGNNPRLFKKFQGRGIYFGTTNYPNSLWASRPFSLDNFDQSIQVTDADPYNFTIDSVAVKPIKHAIALRNGLLIFNDDGVTQLKAESGKAVTGSSAIAEPQIYSTVSDAVPLTFNLDVLYATEGSQAVYAMLYTDYTESFKIQDISILASHLIGPEKSIKRFIATQRPSNMIYMPLTDGRELSLTYQRDQEVYAWAQHETNGSYIDSEVIMEGGIPVKYQLVRRYIRGNWRQYIERVPVRKDEQVEDYWGVDCGVTYPLTQGTDTLSADTATGTTTLTTGSAIFTAGNIGDIVYYAGGKLELTAYVSSTKMTATWIREPTKLVAQHATTMPVEAQAGEWEYATPVTTVGGLWHLEGETVSVLADGDAFIDKVVSNGQISLDWPATKIYVGLGYTCEFQSMPLISNQASISAKPKHIYAVFPRLLATRGMEFSADGTNYFEMKDRSDEDWGTEIALRSDLSEILLSNAYTLDKYFYGRQRWPLPATILGYTAELDYGDVG